jgi:isopropylmalate/homocitrate/citramalate synthase
MTLEQKIDFFKLLVKIGFKEIEVDSPQLPIQNIIS